MHSQNVCFTRSYLLIDFSEVDSRYGGWGVIQAGSRQASCRARSSLKCNTRLHQCVVEG
jgi:hypothetical protein